jgi:GNAT superfamily N-acetyltransferase
VITLHIGITVRDPRVQELLDYEYIGMYGEPDPDPRGGIYGSDAILLTETSLSRNTSDFPIAVCGVSWSASEKAHVLHRLFVRYSRRGQGHSRTLMTAAELFVRQNDGTRLILETGETQTAALALYKNLGYTPTEPFGYYADQPTSRFLGKDL